MPARILPRDLKKAVDLIEADPARAWNLSELAATCGMARRTLHKRFRRFVGCGPLEFLHDLRFELARKELLAAPAEASVTAIATRCGFGHLGRFAGEYFKRYGEKPLATLSRSQRFAAAGPLRPAPLSSAINRPTVAVVPFELIGPGAKCIGSIAEEIAAALLRLRWINVVASDRAQYRLHGKIRGDGRSTLRITVLLFETTTGRYVWADHHDGDNTDLFSYLDRAITRIVRGVERSLRASEIDRVSRRDPPLLNAWELTMRALPSALSFEPAADGMALELLERAMELAPKDALPAALAAWCHGLRAGHHFTPRPEAERQIAQSLAARAAELSSSDPLAETLLAAGYTLAHDLRTAAVHVGRALRLDAGSSWAWGRSGWLEAYSGKPGNAIEHFEIARNLAPDDSLSFLWAIGIGAAHFEAARYDQAIGWFERGLAERPTAVWNHRFLVPAYIMAGGKEEARQRFGEFARAFPELTIAQVRSGLPYTVGFLDRVAEGLESVGMRIS